MNPILDWPCRICGKPNRKHWVFWSPEYGYHIRQSIAFRDGVPSKDHYADPPKNNLEYLEYRYGTRFAN